MKLNGKKYVTTTAETAFQGQSSLCRKIKEGRYWNKIGQENAAANLACAEMPFLQTTALPICLSAFAERVFFSVDEFVYKAGDEIKYIYFPETAMISELQTLEGGETIEIAMLGAKEIVGLQAIFGSSKAASWTMSFFTGSALRVSTDIIKQEFYRGGALQTLILKSIGQYISQISQRAVCNAHHSIEKRLCFWLIMLHDRCRSDDFLVTQEQLAYFLGVYRPSITQVAQTLRKKKIIEYVRGKISIVSRKKLEETACFCYSNIDNCYKA